APGVEVVPLHLGLGALDLARDQAGLDGLILPDAQAVHDPPDPIPAEDAHQIVVEGDEEPGGAGIALPARSAAQLVVDAAALVAFGADDVQAPVLVPALR